MAKKKPLETESIKELSSDELFELARQKKEEEQRQLEEQRKKKLKELRDQRRTLITKHRKELAAIDNEIARLQGRGTTKRGGKGRVSATEAVIEIISKAGRITTTELKKQLSTKGVTVGNLPQTLAYLKRQGRITSPARATYEIAQ